MKDTNVESGTSNCTETTQDLAWRAQWTVGKREVDHVPSVPDLKLPSRQDRKV